MGALAAAILAAIVAASALSARPANVGEAAARKAIALAYGRLGQAASRGDTSSVLALMTPDYALKLPDGRVVTREEIRVSGQQRAPEQRLRQVYTIRKLTVRKARAVATVDVRVTPGVQDPEKGQPPAFVLSQCDTWVKTRTGWLLERSEQLSGSPAEKGKHTQGVPAADPLEAVLSDVADAADRIPALAAGLRITQWTLRNSTAGDPDFVRVGSVRLMKPNLARVDIGPPGRQTIAADGRSLWLVDYESRTYLKRITADPGSISVPQAELVSSFFPAWARSIGRRPGVRVRCLGSEADSGREYRVVETQAPGPDAASEVTTRLFVGASGLIERTVQDVRDGDSHFRIEARLTHIATQQRLSAASFAYKPPASFRPYGRPADDRDLLAVGTPAPHFTLPLVGGGTISLGGALQQSKGVLLSFWHYG